MIDNNKTATEALAKAVEVLETLTETVADIASRLAKDRGSHEWSCQMTAVAKTVRMAGTNVTEVNFSEHGLFSPQDDGAFYLPAAAVEQALKAGLVLSPLSQSRRLQKVLDAALDLDESPIRTSIMNVIADDQLAAWHSSPSYVPAVTS